VPCNLSPNKVLLGPEYALVYIIPDIVTKLLVHWEKAHARDENYLNKKFDLFHSCLKGKAAN
jgi:hypothetical protein